MILRSLALIAILAASTQALAQLTAEDDNRTILLNTSVTLNILSNDIDTRGGSFTLESTTQPLNGAVVVNNDNSVTYRPNLDFVGADTFQYTIINDGEIESPLTSIATVTISVVNRTLPLGQTTDNIRSISDNIDSICANLLENRTSLLDAGRTRLLARCEGLLALSDDPEAVSRALRSISPEETLALSRVGVSNSKLQSSMVSNRMSGRSQTGLSYGAPGFLWSSDLGNSAVGDNKLLAKIGLFASLKWENAEKDTTDAETGFDSDSWGLTIGGDYALSTKWFAGLALGYTENELSFASNGGMESSEFSLTGYSSYSHNNLTFDFQLGLGSSGIDIDRNIEYQEFGNTFNAVAVGETNGTQWFASSQIQTLLSKGAMTFYPSLKLQYATSKIDGYAENEANGWELVLSDQDVARLTLDAGVQATYAWNQSWGVLLPNFELIATADLNTDQGQVNGSFANGPVNSPSFNLSAEEPDSFFYQAGVGFSFVLPGGTSGFLSYREILGFDDFSSNEWQAGFRMEFN